MNNINNITVVGGGTAGWLTALFVNTSFPTYTVTVIESSEIGILGAGEGSTPNLIGFLKNLGINIEDVIRYAKGTFKNGIKFTNWDKTGSSYFHGFADNRLIHTDNIIAYIDSLIKFNNDQSMSYQAQVSNKNKVKFTRDFKNNELTYTLSDFSSHGSYSLHFDAVLLAKFLKRIALERGILCIDGIVQTIETDTDDFITKLKLDDGRDVVSDFVFDCTGFKRLIIGSHYKTKWKDYSNHIPNNRALPFFLNNTTEIIPPYTEAIAMKYGWVWKIPVQGRFGCGYVFDSTQVTDQEIIEELENYFEQEIISPRAFNFQAGCFENTWVKNCIAIGLSSGFIEPLEATSIMLSIISLEKLKERLPGVYFRDQKYIDLYNKDISQYNSNILNFIYLHYITNKTDTAYWSNFTHSNVMPSGLKDIINIITETPIVRNQDFLTYSNDYIFGAYNYSIVSAGNDIINKVKLAALKQSYEQSVDLEDFKIHAITFENEVNQLSSNSVDHYDMIQYLRTKIEN